MGEIVELRQLSSGSVLTVWPVVAPELERALAHSDGENSLEDVLNSIMNNLMQLWVVREGQQAVAFCVTEINGYRQFKSCRIVLLAGSGIAVWHEVVEHLEPWAREQGCTVMEAWSRPGFEKYGKMYGYKKRYVVMRKRLQSEPDTRNLH